MSAMSPLFASIVLSVLIICARARCRCFSEELLNKSKPVIFTPGGPVERCQQTVPKKEMEHTFPDSPDNVRYTLTYVGDDLVNIYVNGKIISTDNDFPKRRYTVDYVGPCADIMANITNFDPSGQQRKSGAGLSLLVKHGEDVYGTVQQNSFNYCGEIPKCADESATFVRPIFSVGMVEPPEDCLTSPETCDFSTWEHTVVSDHTLDRPLCEFVIMGNLGALPLNPDDGEFPHLKRFGVKIHLPFCNT